MHTYMDVNPYREPCRFCKIPSLKNIVLKVKTFPSKHVVTGSCVQI